MVRKLAPAFPKGKMIHTFQIPKNNRGITQDSIEKLNNANEDVREIVANRGVMAKQFRIYNLVMNPTTIKHWLNKACLELYGTSVHITYSYSGSRDNGYLYALAVDGPSPRMAKNFNKGKKASEEITQRV